MNHTKINQAIEDHYALWWTDEMKTAMNAALSAEELALVHTVSDFANNGELWMTGSHDANYEKVQGLLSAEFPWLSSKSVIRAATSAAWGWR
jgi:hypothetical protein